MTTTAPAPVYTLLTPTFQTWPRALNWAFHVARTGHRHCRVTKHPDGWHVAATPLGSAT